MVRRAGCHATTWITPGRSSPPRTSYRGSLKPAALLRVGDYTVMWFWRTDKSSADTASNAPDKFPPSRPVTVSKVGVVWYRKNKMAVTLLTTGLLCVIAAIVGGGIEAFGGKVPVIQSSKRQTALGLFGILLLLGAYVSSSSNVPSGNGDATPPPVSRIDRQRARTELAQFISLAKTHRLHELQGNYQYTSGSAQHERVFKFQGQLSGGTCDSYHHVEFNVDGLQCSFANTDYNVTDLVADLKVLDPELGLETLGKWTDANAYRVLVYGSNTGQGRVGFYIYEKP